MACSLPIVQLTQTSVSLNVETINRVLTKVGNRPFAFYSINGNFRTGKSLMLNFFLQYLNGYRRNPENWFQPQNVQRDFHWRGGAQPDTDGINIWSEPFEVQLENGQTMCILLMDTQGSFDSQSSLQHNAIIFALSSLLSSVMIMNVSKQISDDILQFFQFFIGYAQMAVEDPNVPEDVEKKEIFFQKLIFLIRDFQWIRDYPAVYYDDNSPDPNYKRDQLSVSPKNSPEGNFIRQQINQSFDNVGVGLLQYPGDDLALQDDLTNISDNFLRRVKAFIENIFSPCNLVPKKVGGHQVTGNEFKKFVESWARVFSNTDKLPNVRTIHDTTAYVQGLLAMKNGLACYDSEMKSFLDANPEGVSDEEFFQHHLEFHEKSYKVFRSVKRLGGKQYESQFCEELQSEIEPRMESFKTINETRRKAAQELKRLEAEQAELKGEMDETKRKFEDFEKRTKVERERLDGQLQQMREKERQMQSEMQKSAQAREALSADYARLQTQMQQTEGQLNELRSGGGLAEVLAQMQEQNQMLMQTMERNAEASRIATDQMIAAIYANSGGGDDGWGCSIM